MYSEGFRGGHVHRIIAICCRPYILYASCLDRPERRPLEWPGEGFPDCALVRKYSSSSSGKRRFSSAMIGTSACMTVGSSVAILMAHIQRRALHRRPDRIHTGSIVALLEVIYSGRRVPRCHPLHRPAIRRRISRAHLRPFHPPKLGWGADKNFSRLLENVESDYYMFLRSG